MAQLLGSRLFCSPAKRATLKLLDLDPDWMALLCDRPEDADVHLLAQGETLRPGVLAKRLEAGGSPWVAIVGLRATGWSHAARGGPLREWREGAACVVGVPYSEHSSWTDLRSCIASMRPARVVPTVNASSACVGVGGCHDRGVDHDLALTDRCGLTRGAQTPPLPRTQTRKPPGAWSTASPT